MALYKKYNKQVQFIVVDTQASQSMQLAQMFQVRNIPAIFFIDAEGQLQGKIIGDTTYDILEANIKKIID